MNPRSALKVTPTPMSSLTPLQTLFSARLQPAISGCTSRTRIRKWRGADSLQFLRHAAELARAEGFRFQHVDSTIILERPKLRDYRETIRRRLADTLGITYGQMSVKFKTSEKVGPVGEGKSAEAQAVVTLVR